MSRKCTMEWKVYGEDGHRQRESFNKSYIYDFSKGDSTRIIEVENADKTGTNEYTLVRITRNTFKECKEELEGQITDGIFENSRVGKVIRIETEDEQNRGFWDWSVLNADGDIIGEDFDYETEEEAEAAAMNYIEENGITDYTLDVSQPDA